MAEGVKSRFKEDRQSLPGREARDNADLIYQRRHQYIGWFVAGTILSYFFFKGAVFKIFHGASVQDQQLTRHLISPKEAERIFLTIPNVQSAFAASRVYASHPHLAGSDADFQDARSILSLFQNEFQIPHREEPIFPAGSKESRDATLRLTSKGAKQPSAWVDVYYTILNTPLNRSLSIINDDGNIEWEANLVEDGDPRDAEAHKYRDAVPTFHGFSREGDVTGELIYADYGRQEDYAQLIALGTNFTGKIVIARHGDIIRGLKVKGAQELGAAGVLTYSDPRDDGFVTVANGYAPYPAGPARNPTSVERGSVQFDYPGDPTTPGYPSYQNAKRVKASNIPDIPSLPISWGNAQRLLEEIGDIYIEDENGDRKLSGKASKKRIRLVNNADTKVTPIWNTMAAIPGYVKNEVVVIGCHRDAWVLGAADPTSGTVSLHEIIRGLGTLLRAGWKPLRTIVIASWDAEEYGLIGSTEWGEDFPDWISKNVVAYLNVDASAYGSRWSVGGSPSLAHLIRDVAQVVDHPTHPGKKLWDARMDEGPYKGLSANSTVDQEYINAYEQTEATRRASKTGVEPLGSGSDFTVFLQRLGVASTDQGFGFTSSDAVYHYHSIYDSPRWQEIYGDPGFYRHVAVSKHLGTMGLRMAVALLLPFNTTQYALELDDYLDHVETLASEHLDQKPDFSALRAAIHRVQDASLKLDDEKRAALEDFEKLLLHLPTLPPSSYILTNPSGRRCCERRGGQVHMFCKSFKRRVTDWIKSLFGVPPVEVTAIGWDVTKFFGEDSWDSVLGYAFETAESQNGYPRCLPRFIRRFIGAARRLGRANKKLAGFEGGFVSEDGIKGREWFKHLGVAPGKWLGYGATTLPALSEAITIEKNSALASYEAARLTELMNKLAASITPA